MGFSNKKRLPGMRPTTVLQMNFILHIRFRATEMSACLYGYLNL